MNNENVNIKCLSGKYSISPNTLFCLRHTCKTNDFAIVSAAVLDVNLHILAN